jgi:NAD(P)-dependent dehydrogenase (short-subunit alcohol dehydrogenase family)
MNETRWFVTDAAEGFGRVWAEAALEGGGTVVATATDISALAPLVDIHGDAVLPLELDVDDREAIAAAASVAESRFGGIDIVVSDPGSDRDAAIDDVMRERGAGQIIHPLSGAPADPCRQSKAAKATEAILQAVDAEDRFAVAA